MRTKLHTFLAAACVLAACSSKSTSNVSSSDILQFKSHLNTEVPVDSAKWEKFRFPEQDNGMLPDHAEMTLLVAEISSTSSSWFASGTLAQAPMPPNGAIRQWLSATSKKILLEGAESNSERCKDYVTTLHNGATAVGFACTSDDKILLYVVLSSEN